MNIDLNILDQALCNAMCAEVKAVPVSNSLLSIETPFFFADGDPYQFYIKEMAGGILRLTDMGHTMMHLSYENDVDKFRLGTRGKLFEQIKSETFVEEDNGEFYIDTELAGIGASIFRLGQALTKINDLTFLNKARVESTFYEDLFERLTNIVSAENIIRNYEVEGLESAADYTVDFKITGKNLPLYLFGVPGGDKAKLTTIILQRLLLAHKEFDSLIVFADQSTIPKPDLSRLMNVGGEMIASLDAQEDLKRKVLKKVA